MTYGKNNQDQNKEQNDENEDESSLMDTDDNQKLQNKQQAKPSNKQQEETNSTFKEFLSKVFQNEEVRSLADARLAIEEEFEHNFKPDRDHLDYLKQKQDSNKVKNFQSPIRQKKLAQIKQMQERESQMSGSNKDQANKGNIIMGRRKSNVSMNDEYSQEANRSKENQQDQQMYSDDDEDDEDYYSQESNINESSSSQRNQIPQSKIKQSQKLALDQEEQKQEEFGLQQSNQQKKRTYFDRCKEVGRIGPSQTKLDLESGGQSSVKLFGQDSLEVEALSQFASIRANTAVFQGRYYYEVKLLTSGLMQIGWCTLGTPFMLENGVGDDETSYAFDGYRVKKWNGQNQIYGEAWAAGDIIGSLIDFERREITFWRNDKCLGVAFKNFKIGPNMAYFPAISFSASERVLFNFGRRPFRIRSNYTSCAINEPDCFVNNYYSTAMFIVETIKRYVVTYYDFPNLTQDERLMVGSILFEYLIPLMNDQYIMEDLILQFFFELVMIPKPELYELIVKTMEIHMSTEQLIEWTGTFMSILCRKINEIQLARGEKETNKEFDLNYMKIILQLMSRDTFMYSWLCSDNYYEDLENLYMLHLPSQSDWDQLITKLYHELLPGTHQNKQQYQDQQKHVLRNLKITQKYWLQITDLLMDKRKRCPLDSQAPKAPFDLYIEFLHYLVYKNNGYSKNVKPPGLTPPTTLANVFFSASRHLDSILYSQPMEKFPFHCFFMREQGNNLLDENLKSLERVGGTFSHLENELNQSIRLFYGKPITNEQRETFTFVKNLILIFIYGVSSDVSAYVKCLEKIFVNSRNVEDFTPRGKEDFGGPLMQEMVASAKKLVQYQLIFYSEANRTQIHKFSLWLMRLMNYVDEKYNDLLYIMPENFVEIPFEVFRAFKRGGNILYENEIERNITFKDEYEAVYNTEELKQTSFAQELVKYISKHFYDPKIANPDQKEIYLTRLNILLQYESYIKLFENYEFSQENLLPLLMKSFDKRFIFAVTKNFLRFSKGKGFKEINNQNLVEKTQSDFFLGRLRIQLLQNREKLSIEFMNALFNILNDMTTELFVVFKELKNSFSINIVKRTKQLFQMVIDLCRLLEVISKWVPEIFVDKEQIHSSRLLNYIMFVLNSIFSGSIDGYIEFFAQKTQQRSDTLPQFLAPILSILKNLYDAVNNLGIKDNIKYDNLADIFQKTDSFDSLYFEKIQQVVKNELPPADLNEKQVFETFEQMIDEIEMLCKCNKIRKHSMQSMGSDVGAGGQTEGQEGQADQFDEDLMCNICYFNEKNTVFDPCGHQSCQKCIQVHTLNSERCPFCNAVIKETKKIK